MAGRAGGDEPAMNGRNTNFRGCGDSEARWQAERGKLMDASATHAGIVGGGLDEAHRGWNERQYESSIKMDFDNSPRHSKAVQSICGGAERRRRFAYLRFEVARIRK